MPDEEYPFILSTGRQLEHWHTGSMTRRAMVLDAIEPSATAQVSRGTIAKLGIQTGDMIRVTTRRGTVELSARQDDAIPDGVVFIPFAYVEAAANLLTNPKLDPFGQIPEFKYCAAGSRRSVRSARRRNKISAKIGLKMAGISRPFFIAAPMFDRSDCARLPSPRGACAPTGSAR